MANPIKSEELEAVLLEIANTAPALEPLRDGAIIGKRVCGLTIGRLALMSSAKISLFSGRDDKSVDLDDIMAAIYITVDDNIDEAIWLCGDRDALMKRVKKFWWGYGTRGKRKAVAEFINWLTDVYDCMSNYDDDGSVKSDRWWASVVDILAGEYGWSEYFILWELPLLRAVYYQECIYERLSGEKLPGEIKDTVINALEKAQEVMSKNG